MKTKSKISSLLAMFLTLCMLMSMAYVPAYAADTLTPAETTLLAPKSGQNTYVAYEETLETEGTLPKGVYVQNNKIVLDGDEVTGGTFKVNGQNVTVADTLYYEDFQDETENATQGAVKNTKFKKLDGTDAASFVTSTAKGIVAKEDNNLFASGTINEAIYSADFGESLQNVKRLTIKLRFRKNQASNTPNLFYAYTQTGGLIYNFGTRSTGDILVNNYHANAGDVSVTYDPIMGGGGYSNDAWHTMRIELDFSKVRSEGDQTYYGQCAVYVDDVKQFTSSNNAGNPVNNGDFAILANEPTAYLKSLTFGVPVDDIEIYSGTPCGDFYTLDGDSTLLAPPKDTISKIDYKTLGVDGNELSGITYSVSNAPDGVSVDGNSVVLLGATVKSGTFTLNSHDGTGRKIASKDITIHPTRYYADFEDATTSSEAKNYAFKNLDGSDAGSGAMATSSGTIAEEGGNKYVSGAKGAGNAVVDLGTAAQNATKLTVELRGQNTVESTAAYSMIFVGDSNDKCVFNMDIRATNNTCQLSFNSNGDSQKIDAINASVGSWIDFRLELDFTTLNAAGDRAGSYTLYGNENVLGNIKDYWMPAQHSKGTYAKKVSVGFNYADEIAVYSGVKYTTEYTISGADTLVVPESGKFAKNEYTVADSTGAEAENAELSIIGETEGFKLINGGLVVSGDAKKAEECILVAKNSAGKILATKSIKLSGIRYAEDFSDKLTMPSLDGTNASTSMLLYNEGNFGSIVEENGNHYLAGAVNTKFAVLDLGENFNNSKKTVIKAKYLWNGTSDGDFIYVYSYNGSFVEMVRVCLSSGQGGLWTFHDKNGVQQSGAGIPRHGKTPAGEWTDLEIVLDYENYTYTVATAGVVRINNYKMRGSGYAKRIYLGAYIDDITVYNGDDFSISSATNSLEIPGAGEKTQQIGAVYSDGSAVNNVICTSNVSGITASGNAVTVSSALSVAPVELTLSDGFVSNKVTCQTFTDYILVGGSEYEAGMALGTGSKTIKVANGKSDADEKPFIVIAHYAGNKLVSATVAKKVDSVYTAEITKEFKSGETVKIFKWEDGTVTPLEKEIILN